MDTLPTPPDPTVPAHPTASTGCSLREGVPQRAWPVLQGRPEVLEHGHLQVQPRPWQVGEEATPDPCRSGSTCLQRSQGRELSHPRQQSACEPTLYCSHFYIFLPELSGIFLKDYSHQGPFLGVCFWRNPTQRHQHLKLFTVDDQCCLHFLSEHQRAIAEEVEGPDGPGECQWFTHNPSR